jgi:DNA invertase Pin-like site-specific DNA recombinase
MSTNRQEASIPDQKAWAARVVTTHGLHVVSEPFQDAAIPGSEVERRPGLMAMLAFCEEAAQRGQAVNTIIVWDADRLSRADSIRTAAVVDRLMTAGVSRLLTAEGWVDFEDDVDRVLFNLKQDMARSAFSKGLSKTVTRSAITRAKGGFWVAGKAPLGYRIVGPKYAKKLVLGPEEEVALVVWMFDTYVNTGATLGDIARMLNERPETIRPRSGRWSRDTVRKMLTNRAYLGEVVWNGTHQGKYNRVTNGEVTKVTGQRGKKVMEKNGEADKIIVEGAHPALIPPDLFRRAREKRIVNAWKPGKSVPHKGGEWVLSGLVRCADCGGVMTGHKEEHHRKGRTYTYRRYFCAANSKGGKGTCRMSSVREEELLSALAEEVKQVCSAPDRLAELVAEIEWSARALSEATQARLVALAARLAELNRDIQQGNQNLALLPPDRLEGVIGVVRGWEDERDRLLDEQADLLTAAAAHAADAEQLSLALAELGRLEELLTGEAGLTSPAEQREALAGLISKVVVHFDHSRPKNKSHAKEIEVEWVFDLPGQSISG